MQRIDIGKRNKKIIKLYMAGISRKQIARLLDWEPVMTYEAVKKVIQNRVAERRRVVRYTVDRRRV